MTTKKICFIVLCVLLAAVIILFAVVLGKVSTLFGGSSTPATTEPSTQATDDSSPTESSDTTPTQPTATAHEHNYEFSRTVPASCDSYGMNVYVCTLCGDEKMPDDERIDPLGHDLSKTVVAPTCTDDGYTELKCSRCAYTEKQEITAALGHELDGGTQMPATCIDNAHTLYKCTREGCEYTEKKDEQYNTATGLHTYGPWMPDDQGKNYHQCIHCGNQEYGDSITGYEYVDGAGQRTFVITVGTDENPNAYTYTVIDCLLDAEPAFRYDPSQGLIVTFTGPDGQPQSYTMAKESNETITIDADGTIIGG